MLIQKVLKVGASAAVTIPKRSLGVLGINIGDRVNVAIDSKYRVMAIAPMRRYKADEALLEWTRKFIKRYHPALTALAKK